MATCWLLADEHVGTKINGTARFCFEFLILVGARESGAKIARGDAPQSLFLVLPTP